MMNKNSFEIAFKGIIVLGLLIVITLQMRPKESIVYVDSLNLLSKYKGFEAAKAEHEIKTRRLNANLDTLRVELEHSIQKYESEKSTASEKELNQLKELLMNKEQQFLSYQQTVKDQLQKEDKEISQKLLSKINDYIKRYGEAHDHKIILAATQIGNIAYGHETKNITEEVLVGLNNEYIHSVQQ